MEKKKLLVSLAALATGLIALHSCNSMKETTPPGGELHEVEVFVTLDEPVTKTVNQDNKTLWVDGDKISVIGTEYGEEEYIANYLTYRGNNTFGGRISYPGDDNNWYFAYPYREDNVSPQETHITVDQEQTQTGNDNMEHIAGEGFPLIGKVLALPRADQISVHMTNVLARLDYVINNTLETPIVVKQVVFTAPQKIGGNFVGDMTKDNISWTAKSGSYHSVTLNVVDGEEIAAEGQAAFHAGILTTTINAGESMKIKIVAVDPSAPNTEIVFYKEYPMTSKQHLMAGKTYDFTLNFDADHQTDPNPQTEDPDEPENPDDPNPGGNDEPTTVPAYVKVTKAPDSWDGTYLFVDENSSKAFAAFSGNADSYAVNVTIQDGKILATNDNAKYALTVSDAGEQHDNASGQEAYNVKNSDGKYIFFSSGEIQILDTNQKASGGSSSSSSQYTYYHAFQYDNGVQVMSSGHSSGFNKYYLGYNDNKFGYYTESNSSSTSSSSYYMSNASSLRVQLYKLSEVSGGGSSDPNKQNQTLSFAQSSVTLTMATAGGTQAVQTVSGAQTAVTYNSTNANVATVSGTTITITGFGSTTITATAAESDTYNSASASYTLNVQQSGTSTVTTYTKASSLTVGGTYVIVDVADQRLFKGASDGTYVSVSPSNGVISDPNNSYAGYEFTVTQSGSKYCLVFNDGKYLLCDYSNSGDSTTGLTFVSSQPADNYLYDVTVSNSVFEFSTAQRNSTSSSSNHEVLYYKTSSMSGSGQDKFKIGASGAGVGVHLYLKTASGSGSGSGKQNQTLSFANPTVTLTMATASGTQAVQTVSGAQTTVTYSSSNTNVATVSGTTITIKGFGSTTITATAAENSNYNSASAAYTLNIQQSGSSSSSTERTYTYQTSVSAGTYLIGGYESSGSNQYSIALFPTVQSGTWESSQGTASGQYIPQRNISSDNTITFTDDSEVFNAEVELIASGSSWKIKTSAGYLVASGNYVITFTSNESSATAFTISGGSGSGYGMGMSGSEMGISSGDYYFYHSGSAQGFSIRNYQVSNIRLYKKTSEGGSTSGKQNQNLSFANATVTQTLANASGTLSVQQVSGAQTTVTYSSSNSSVATVNGTTITIHGFGSTTITATAAESSNYNSASASYTLIINQSSGGGSSTGERTYTYVAPNNLQEGTYIIAGSETNELSVALFPSVSTASWNSQQTGQVNNGQYIPHKVVGTSNSANTITSSDSDVIASEVELVKSGNNWRFLVKSTNQYLSTPSAEYRIAFGAESSAASFSISSGTNGATVQTGSYYFYHSGSAGGFTLRTNSTSNLRFYQLTSGGDSSGKQYQSLSFAYSTETLPLESASGTYPVQEVKGAQTTVTYSSSNTSVATVNGTTLTITGYGSTTITANAASNDYYYSASASYTLTVKKASQTGVYLLENEAIEDYLNRAESNYTADNHGSGSGGGWGGWGGGSSSSDGLSYVSTILSTYGNPSASNRLDWPAPATVSWTQSVTASNCTLAVYYDQAYTNEEIMAVPQISNTSADIYNLIPGKTYYWVLKNGNTTVASGHFDTEGRRRMVGIGQKSNYGQNYANNCRDLGGQVTRTGKKIKYGRMYRGSNMDNTTAEQKKYLLEKLKIRLDVDLRTGNGSSSSNGNNTYNALKNNDSGVTMNDITNGDYNTYVGHTQEQYSGGSDLTNAQKMGPTLMRIMNAIHNGVNVYIHCMVGADRTGGTCLYLESLLGVEPERCDMDFEMTSFSCVGSRTRNGSSPEQYYTVYNAIKNTSGDTWQQKAINYCVNTLGVSSSMITQFQNDMLE